MKFNPFAENKAPSRSMFAKEQKKQILATAEAVKDLEERYTIKEFLGVKMNYETRTFLKALIDQGGEEEVQLLVERVIREEDEEMRIIDNDGALTRFSCGDLEIAQLPKLPSTLESLYCYSTELESLPELPEGLRSLNIEGSTLITTLPELPEGLEDLILRSTEISRLPNLPSSLLVLDCSWSPIALDLEYQAELKAQRPNLTIFAEVT